MAKRVQGGSDLTATGQVLGTPSYMPPEQAAGKLTQIGPASDVYSLGAVLYCLLTGRPPFQSANPVDTLLQVLEQEPISPRQFNPDVPRDLETIALKCLEKNPVRRYVSAESLADDLRRWLNHEPIQARPSTAWERSLKWAKRRPAVAALAAAVLATLVAGTVVSSYFAIRANAAAKRADTKAADALTEKRRANENAQTATANADEALANAKKAQIEMDRADAKPHEARRLLYWAHMNLAQRNWEIPLFGLVLDSLEITRPESGETDLRGFEWYYWNRLASAGHDGTVKVWDATSGQETLTLKGHTDRVHSVALSPDGKRLASAGGYDQTVKVWDSTSGQEILTLKGHTNFVTTVAFSADGKRLVSASNVTRRLKPAEETFGHPSGGVRRPAPSARGSESDPLAA